MRTTLTFTINHNDLSLADSDMLLAQGEGTFQSGERPYAGLFALARELASRTKEVELTIQHVPGWRAGRNQPGHAPSVEPVIADDFESACYALADAMHDELGERKEQSARSGGEEMIAHNTMVRALESAIAVVRRKADDNEAEEFWLPVGDTIWWVACQTDKR